MSNLHTLLMHGIPSINLKLHSINRGGCGQFALQLSTALAARDIPSEVVLVKYGGYNERDIARMLKHVQDGNINTLYRRQLDADKRTYGMDLCIGHICVRVDGKLYDSDGTVDYTPISDCIEPDVLALLVERGRWNPTFLDNNSMSGSETLDIMKEHISSALSEVVAC